MLHRYLYTSALLWAAGACVFAAQSGSDGTDPADFDADDIIHRDVAIVGGGSSGTYTAVRLRDHGKSVVVIEPQGHLGGHAETWVDPETGFTVDIGVIVFAPVPTVTDYFARFGVPLINVTDAGGGDVPALPVDFSTGRIVTDFTPPSDDEVGAAIQAFAALSQKYPELQESFNLTYPVDPELLMPFGDFVAKYNLGALTQYVFSYQQGYTPLLHLSTLYIIKAFTQLQLDVALTGVPFLTTAHHNVQELYQNIAADLGSDDVLLNSSVLAVRRCNDGVEPARLVVQTPVGRKLVVAKKIVLAAPPTLRNLAAWDLVSAETALFSRFHASGYYTGLLNNTGVGPVTLANIGSADRPYRIPALPGPYALQWNGGANLTQVYYASPDPIGGDAARVGVVADLNRYKAANGVPASPDPDWVTFSDHAPFNMMVSNEDIQNRFYEKLFALQGERGTFYNGAAWLTHDSSALWQFTNNYVLPILLASL